MQSVLIVEPDPLLQDALSSCLVAVGYTAVVASDGLSGLHQARTLQPALVVLDLPLPIVAGPTVMRFLRRIPATQDVPIVALSLMDELPSVLLDIPNVTILIKPFPLATFVETVATFAATTPAVAPQMSS